LEVQPEIPIAEQPAAVVPAAEQTASGETEDSNAAALRHLKGKPGPGFWDQVMQNIGIGR